MEEHLTKFKSHVLSRGKDSTQSPVGLKGAIYRNIDTLRRIRRTHTALLSSVALPTMANPEEDLPELPSVSRQRDASPLREPPSVRRSLPIEGGDFTAIAALKLRCAQILEHAGFEGTVIGFGSA